ncbi:hypothetical protein JNL27_05530 [bacterium]|nr:hypothetical protein [bacterium]
MTDRYYIWDPLNMSAGSVGYNAWVALNNVIASPAYDRVLGRQVFVGWNLGETTTGGPYVAPLPEVGTIFRVNTTKPNNISDIFSFTATGNTVTTAKKDLKKGLKNIKVVPNPFYIFSSFDTPYDRIVKFMNLPASCTIRIFTVAGDLVRTIYHNASSNNDRVDTDPFNEKTDAGDLSTSTERWDLKTANGRYAASGIYFAVIETSYGKVFVKFAIIQYKSQ